MVNVLLFCNGLQIGSVDVVDASIEWSGDSLIISNADSLFTFNMLGAEKDEDLNIYVLEDGNFKTIIDMEDIEID